MKTIKGRPCVHTGADGTKVEKRGDHEVYYRVQLLPAGPQRLEWVAERNLKEINS